MFSCKIVLPAYVVAFLMVLSFQQAFGALQEPYVNEEYGFFISPPQGWIVQEESEGEILVYFLGPIDEGFRININILVEETQMSLQDYVDFNKDQLLSVLGASIILEGSRIIQGHEAYEVVFTWVYQTYDFQQKQVYLVEKGNGYVITFSALQTNYDSYITDFDESVDTFEFSAMNGEVKFRGVATTDEQWGETVCYGSYYCNVTLQEILYDPNNTLLLDEEVTICYNQSLPVKAGDQVECYGYYWKEAGPMQCVGRVECVGNDYYVIPEFQSLLILPLFMISTLLALIIYRRKHTI